MSTSSSTVTASSMRAPGLIVAAGEAPLLRDLRVHQGLGIDQLLPVVHPDEDLPGARRRRPCASARDAVRDDVGQVELLLRVVRLEGGERLAEQRERGREDAWVDLARPLLVVAPEVLLLADLADLPGGIAQDAAVARRRGHLAGRHREAHVGLRAGERVRDASEVLRDEQRHVAVEDEADLGGAAHGREPGRRSVSRPSLLALHGGLDAIAEGAAQILDDAGASVTDDDDDLAAARLERGAHGVVDERPSGDQMEDLRQRALHARPVPCGEDDGGGPCERGGGVSHESA